MKKYSLVGMALIAVSAITTAFIPSSAKTAGDQKDGYLSLSSELGDVTCTLHDGEGNVCSYTQSVVLSATGNGVDSDTDNSTVGGVGTTAD